MSDPAREILAEAGRYIAENGHHKGSMYSEDEVPEPPACAIGAIHSAAGFGSRGHHYVGAVELLTEELHGSLSFPWDGSTIAQWNDHPSTSAEDVILTLKRLGNE